MKTKNILSLTVVFALGIFLGVLGSRFWFTGAEPAADKRKVNFATEAENPSRKENHAPDLVRMEPEKLREFGIKIAKAGSGTIQLHSDLTGEIVNDPGRLAHIIPRFEGIVKEVRKQIGDRVKKGEVLAVIESNESLAPYEVRSLINGTVINMHLTRGELISDATHAFEIADLSRVWANLTIYQKDLPFIHVGQKADISTGFDSQTIEGKISYVSPVVDENTRTAIARVELDNKNGIWRPGMLVEAKVITKTVRRPVVIPLTALQQFKAKPVVFVQTPSGFIPQAVKIGLRNSGFVEILSGLRPNREYVVSGGFGLKAELQKEEFGDDD